MTTQFKPIFLTRQLDLIKTKDLGLKILVIGAGAIGSHAVISLARMGFGNITVYDHDVVDPENMNNQGYDIADIGIPKVEALKQKVLRAIGFEISTLQEKFTGTNDAYDVVISAVDSMEARKMIYENTINAHYVIDPRMAAEFAKLYVMNVTLDKDRAAYETTLYTDGEAIPERCTAKSTIYCASLLAGLVVKACKDIATNNKRYTRVLQWNIAKNSMDMFLAKES